MQTETGTYINANGQPMTRESFYAIQAAYTYYQRGRYASIRYLMKRTTLSYTTALRLITLSLQLIACDKAGI